MVNKEDEFGEWVKIDPKTGRPEKKLFPTQALVNAAWEIAQQRSVIVDKMRVALLKEDNQLALKLARELVGINDRDIERHRAEKKRSTQDSGKLTKSKKKGDKI